MSEYWKSNPRKFCDFCKCWIADNRPSIDFHERGKRHKENVHIRLGEMAKKGREDYEAQQQEGDFLKQMEEEALKAYKKDIEQNPDMMGVKISEIASSKNAEIVITSKKDPKDSEQKEVPPIKKWYEAKSPEGSYYWNIETGASKWEEPEEGFLTLAEQEKLKSKEKKKERKEGDKGKTSGDKGKTSGDKGKTSGDKGKTSWDKGKTSKETKSTSLLSPPLIYGPTKKSVAYSSWEQVKRDEDESKVDYQLPQIAQEEYYGPEISFSKPVVSFEEKKVTLSASEKWSGKPVSFKKRKSAQDNKKSMRQRTDDL